MPADRHLGDLNARPVLHRHVDGQVNPSGLVESLLDGGDLSLDQGFSRYGPAGWLEIPDMSLPRERGYGADAIGERADNRPARGSLRDAVESRRVLGSNVVQKVGCFRQSHRGVTEANVEYFETKVPVERHHGRKHLLELFGIHLLQHPFYQQVGHLIIAETEDVLADVLGILAEEGRR